LWAPFSLRRTRLKAVKRRARRRARRALTPTPHAARGVGDEKVYRGA